MTTPAQRVNDLGGLPGGPVDRSEHANTLFEKRVDALFMLMTNPAIGAFKVDSLRRAVEACSSEEYSNRGYYEKWIYALRDLLIEQQVIQSAELDAWIAKIVASGG